MSAEFKTQHEAFEAAQCAGASGAMQEIEEGSV